MTKQQLEELKDILNQLLMFYTRCQTEYEKSERLALEHRAKFSIVDNLPNAFGNKTVHSQFNSLSGRRSQLHEQEGQKDCNPFPAGVVSKLLGLNSNDGQQESLQFNRDKKNVEKECFEIFSKQEIKEMPRLKDLSYRYRAKDNVHEFRYRRNGLCKSFSSTSLKKAKSKALQFLTELNKQQKDLFRSKNVLFNEFALHYLETFKKPNVAEKTYSNDLNRFQKHVQPAFANIKVTDITPAFIQTFLNGLMVRGIKRTAEGCFYILKSILTYAENIDLIKKSPMFAVKIPLHQRTNGRALTIEAEHKLLAETKRHRFELQYVVQLYAGCRPCELPTIQFNVPGFITFQNKKQRNNKLVYKDVPITPMLEPYVERIKKALPLSNTDKLPKEFSALTGYNMYSLRHTFATRCQECGVPENVVDEWLGHKNRTLTGNVYTHLPQKYMLEQGKKVQY